MCDRQTGIFELTSKWNFFVCGWEKTKGEIYTFLLARQICFAHLLPLQGTTFSFKNLIKAHVN
jgi:hypothetical protein